jgi:pimeloyl-ACP methyl ester carboxylesterase
VHTLVGHDFGSFVAAWSALIRPDVHRSVVLMSAPFAGPPPLPMPAPAGDIHRELAALERPRKHYQWYYSTREAEPDMLRARQGLHAFFRAYYHHKSADWKQNQPHPLKAWSAHELEKMPTYYIMDLAQGMAETVAHEMPSPAEVAANKWLTETEMAVYAQEFARTGFQGSLNWYRCMTNPAFISELQVFAGRTIDVPSCFIAGKSDWGIYQRPGGDILKMQKDALTDMRGLHLLDGAGHWVQQEQADAVNRVLLDFIGANA